MPFATRRAFLWGALSAPSLWPFAEVPYRNYSRCLPDFLRRVAAAAAAKREADLGKIRSAEDVKERQRWVRQTLAQLIGAFPEKTELNAKVTGSLEAPGYRLEKVVYESRPRLYVTANLYIPTSGKPPFPGVLFQLGHSGNGKAWDSYQRACQGLARLGFAVLAFDPMGQGERIYYPDASGLRTRLPGGPDEEHTHPGKQMLLAGTTCTQFQLWDAVRSLDYLAAHPQVDRTRLASTGQSGGGTLTMLLSAVDDRLKTAAVFSGNTENVACANFLPPGSTDDAEQNLVGSGPLGFDRWDVLYPFAPKPMLISISQKDSFGTYSPNYVSNSSAEFEKLSRIYELLGSPGNLSWAETPLPHGLSYDSRLQMYNWMLRQLKGADPIENEPTVAPERDASLWATKTGNVRSLGGETPFTLTRKISIARRPRQLESLLGVERPGGHAMTLKKTRAQNGVTIEALEIQSAEDVFVPAWLFRPAKETDALLILLHPSGRNNAWKEGELCQQLALQGLTVCAVDVRGIGDLTPEFGAGAAAYARSHQMEEDYAWSSLILGKPLLGQRVTDILAVTQAFAGRKIALAALGKMTVPALFAAALDRTIERLYLAGGLSSYRNVIETENFQHSFANFIPDILASTDLPDVVAGLAPRKVVIAGAVDAAGSSATPRAVYSAALQRGHLELREKADWSAAVLLPFCS